jgi:hypothetical protein
MADLERFWRKTPLGPLGVKHKKVTMLYIFNTKVHFVPKRLIHGF